MIAQTRTSLGLIIIFLGVSGFATRAREQNKTGGSTRDASYLGEIERWRAERLKEVNGDDGWNTLVGLFWLKEGQNKFGSDPSGDIVLPKNRAPKVAGSIRLDKEVVRLQATPNAGITHDGVAATDLLLQTDVDGGKPTTLKLGSLTLFVVKRGEKFGLRVKDKDHPARAHFSGLRYFPAQSAWKTEAKFEPYDPDRKSVV